MFIDIKNTVILLQLGWPLPHALPVCLSLILLTENKVRLTQNGSSRVHLSFQPPAKSRRKNVIKLKDKNCIELISYSLFSHRQSLQYWRKQRSYQRMQQNLYHIQLQGKKEPQKRNIFVYFFKLLVWLTCAMWFEFVEKENEGLGWNHLVVMNFIETMLESHN